VKKKIEELDRNAWRELVIATLYNIHYILESTKTLLEINRKEHDGILFDPPYIPAGLYTFAVEEYGKYLYLMTLKENNGKFTIEYSDEFCNHFNKFQRAFSELPDECKLVHNGSFTSYYSTRISQDMDADSPADFDTRARIFYSDIRDGKVTQLPPVTPNFLTKGVDTLRNLVENKIEEFLK